MNSNQITGTIEGPFKVIKSDAPLSVRVTYDEPKKGLAQIAYESHAYWSVNFGSWDSAPQLIREMCEEMAMDVMKETVRVLSKP